MIKFKAKGHNINGERVSEQLCKPYDEHSDFRFNFIYRNKINITY
jgi:hypothetical protein